MPRRFVLSVGAAAASRLMRVQTPDAFIAHAIRVEPNPDVATAAGALA